ncbi:MAG: hypothetical protein NXI10_02825 [bacterium]|nr:hypothetical protein [bacterium]
MRHLILFVSLALFNCLALGQEEDALIGQNPNPNQTSIDFIFCSHIYNNDFISEFNTFNNYEALRPVNSVGLSVSSYYLANKKFQAGFHYSYAQILPHDINLNDTLTGRINGFNFSLSLASINVTPKSKHTNIAFGIGFNTGRLRMTAQNRRSQKNPYFAPALFFNPRFFLGRFVIGLRAEYQFDISRPTWRSVNVNADQTSFALSEFRQTGLIPSFSIGFVPKLKDGGTK